jgi:hypothetical protein
MSEEKITYEDVKEFENFFTMAPPFILERFAKKNTNFVLKFKSKAQSFIDGLNDEQMKKFNIVLNTDIDELQSVMNDAYEQSGKKQYKILANPKYKEFIEINLNELKNMI